MLNSDKRNRLLRLSIFSSLFGKGFSVVTQLLALPLAAGALGLERFGLYAMIATVFVAANMFAAVVATSLSIRIVSTTAKQVKHREVQLFSTALSFVILEAVAIGIILQLVLNFTDIEYIFGLGMNIYSVDLKNTIFVISFLIPLNIIFSLSEAIRSGHQEQFINNLLMAVANIGIICSLFLVKSHPSICNLVIAVYGVPVIARIVNMTLLLRSRPYLFPHFSLASYKVLKSLLGIGAGFVLMQIGSFAFQQFPIIYVGRQTGANNAAYFMAMMQVISISGSLLIVLTQPLLPALSDALVRKDFKWIGKSYQIMLKNIAIYISIFALLIGIFGESIVKILLKSHIVMDVTMQWLWAGFFFIVAIEHVGYIYLAGLGRVWLATLLYLGGASISLVLMLYFFPIYGLGGIFGAMCIGPVLCTVVSYPYLFYKILNQNRNAKAV
jgi:O-antigen/teichoic acid export membrane protein